MGTPRPLLAPHRASTCDARLMGGRTAPRRPAGRAGAASRPRRGCPGRVGVAAVRAGLRFLLVNVAAVAVGERWADTEARLRPGRWAG